MMDSPVSNRFILVILTLALLPALRAGKSILERVYTPKQAARGETAYQAKCSIVIALI
jgi:hypothetical protein